MFFLAVWPWNLMDDLQEQEDISSTSSLCIISSPYVNSNWSYGPETAKWGHDLCDLDLWPLTLTFCMDIMSVNGNNSLIFRMIRWQEHCQKGMTDGQTDRQTGGQTEISVLRAARSQLKIFPCMTLNIFLPFCTPQNQRTWWLRWELGIVTRSYWSFPKIRLNSFVK